MTDHYAVEGYAGFVAFRSAKVALTVRYFRGAKGDFFHVR